MTRKEFSWRYDAFTKGGTWRGLSVGCLFIAFVLAVDPVSNYLKHRLHWSDQAPAILLLVILIAIGISMAFWGKRLARKHGLTCPACNKSLIGKPVRWKVLVTGNCPKCQNKILDDSTTVSTASCGLNRNAFKMEFENFTRQSFRESIWLLVFLFAGEFGAAWFGRSLVNYIDRGGFDGVRLAEWRWCVGIIFAGLAVFSVGILIFAGKGKFLVRRLPCPECSKSLIGRAGRAAIDIGICVHCGSRLFEVSASSKA